MTVSVICNFEEDPIKIEGVIVNICSGAQGQVTRKSTDWCGRNSNSYEILWLSWFDDNRIKQVAQRAIIAHMNPMCQGQISFQKT